MSLRRTSDRHRLRDRRSRWSLTRLDERIVPANQLLPDLHVLYANLTGFTVNPGVEIRFATGMANGGQGPFELNGTTTTFNNPDGSQSQLVNQTIYLDDGSKTTREAGTFTFHPSHGHTHFDDFAIARLRVRPPDQSVGGIVATGPKTSFCLIDINRYDGSLPGSPSKSVYSCSTTKQGISVGWNDVYSSGLDGQSINIAGVPDGDYWLEVEADPANHILESNESNNIQRIEITLKNQPYVGFAIASSQPLGASNGPASFVEVNFNAPVLESSFTAADATLTGPGGTIPITSVTKVNSTQYHVNFDPQNAIGTYLMNIGPDILNSSSIKMDQNQNGKTGETQDAYVNIFTLTAPNVGMITPAGTTAAPVSSVRVTYNRPMDSATFSAADVLTFTGPGGIDLKSTITSVTPVMPGGSSQAYDIAFTAVTTPGVYLLTVGPDVQDMQGNYVDQNNDGTPNSPADNYTSTFIIPIAGTYGPDAFGYTAVGYPLQTISMTGATSVTFANSNDDDAGAVNLGSDTFNFYGIKYSGGSSMFASTNGLLTFGSGNTAYQNDGLTGSTLPTIAALWDDWIIGSASPQTRYLKRDTNGDSINDQLIVEWNQVYHYGTSSNGVTFQAILELNTGDRPGSIIINYPDLTSASSSYNNGASSTVGVRSNAALNSKLVVSQNSSSHPLVAQGKAIKFAIPYVESIVRGDDNPAPDGDVHFLVTFSEPVATLDYNDLVLTTTGMVGAAVHGYEGTADPRVWEIHVDTGYGNGTIRLDVIDNDGIISTAGSKLGGAGVGNGTFKSGEVYDIEQQPPEVQGINIAGGTGQRSRVDVIQVVFTKIVDLGALPADAFQIIGPNGPVGILVDTSLTTPIQTVAKLTFFGSNTEFGSLKDGNYTFTILGNVVTTGGVNLDGDGNGSAGGNYVANLHRLFGDINGDGTVDLVDYGAFRTAFNTNSLAFSFDGTGPIDLDDFGEFRQRFGTSV